MKILCDNPDYPEDKGQVSLEDPGETWPICEQLPCQCLGFGMSKGTIHKLRRQDFANF